MIDKINSEAFELIKLVSSKPIEISNQYKELKGSIKEKGYTDWSGKIVSSSGGKTDYSFNKIELFASENEVECGFDELCYPKFRLLVEEISSLTEFESIISEEFIEKKSFKWILDVYKSQKASNNLIDYLRSETEKNISIYQFYFPILNLTIVENFKIGNVEFMYFTKDYFDNYYLTLKERNCNIDELSFDIKYRKDFQG